MIGRALRIRYDVVQLIGDGPVFRSYVARDRVQGREVCIREFKPPFDKEPEFVDAVRKCVDSLGDVKHPSVERLLEVDEDEGTPFIVGELSAGSSLAERIRRLAPFSVSVAVSTAVSICEGLAALHDAGIVHGDVGEPNIWVSTTGEARLQLAGLWQAYSASQTAGGVVLPAMAPYLAPEVSQGAMPSPSSDVYGVGAILFHLLTGRMPYHAEHPVALAMKHISEPIPSTRSINPSVPVALDRVVQRALAKNPEERYQTAAGLLSDLRMIRDALRFGRKPATSDSPRHDEKPTQVAPAMSAARRPRSKPDEKEWEESEPRDVPTWLVMAMVFLGSLVVFMLAGWLFFNLSRPRAIVVPDVTRLTLREAQDRLQSAQLRVRVARRESNEEVPADTVLESEPPAGAKVYEGNTVQLVVSAGSRFVDVPDLRGRTLDSARELLDTIGLKLDERIEEQRDREMEPGTILAQAPPPRQRAERGTAVRVTVASDRSTSTSAEANKRYLFTIRIRLRDIESSVMLRVDLADSRGTRTVYENEHSPEELVEITAEGQGPQATFSIYYDNELVKQVTKDSAEPDTGEET
ncbi:MAG: serine/threonine-protein kinase [Fimbriimonadaceae bacterium]|nr:serine/threonine-protein kinase [Fimbriimonadaceae bacterium]QOJ11687.1 MAG: PASTA domain-containing protein [Chthonomonadaceae bacterium]